MNLDTIPKPPEVLALHSVSAELYDSLHSWYGRPANYSLDLSSVDAAEGDLRADEALAALALRKLQATRYLSKPGVEVTAETTINQLSDLNLSLEAAVARRSKREPGIQPSELARFEQLRALVADAVGAVLDGLGARHNAILS